MCVGARTASVSGRMLGQRPDPAPSVKEDSERRGSGLLSKEG